MLVSRLALQVLVIGANCYQTSDHTFGLYCDREYYVFVTKDIVQDKHNWATTRFCRNNGTMEDGCRLDKSMTH